LTGDRFGRPHEFVVTAHRSITSARPAPPENSNAALRRAIAVGAQFAEIDVQESKDGVVVVVHDQDLSRLGGSSAKIWDMTAEEIRAVDIGVMAGEEFRGERIATLDEMLAIAKGRIKLNIELKFYGHDQELARRSIDLVKARGMADEVVFQSLSYKQLQDVRRIDPSFQVGYLMAVDAGDPGNLDVDFYSVEQGKADGRFVRTTHLAGREVAAWTVDDSLDMVRLGALGVDNLITNRPEVALRVRALQEQMSVQDRVLKAVQAWLE
jgi:glycerophosphoryl diester phosphodiesterase